MDNIFVQLALILTLSSALGFLVMKFKLPLVIAYLGAGVVLSVVTLFDVANSSILHILPEMGIAFVLFLIGMELDLREIRALGLPIIISSIGQILISTIIGYAIALGLGFSNMEGLYLGLGLAFSSTIVVVKMLLEKRDLTSLYGKLSIGILLVEDLVAIAALMMISVSSSAFQFGLQESLPLLTLILKAVGLFLLTFVLSKFVLERVFDAVAKSLELLFFTAITWCFLFTALAVLSGFSVVIGAFLAGVALASSPYHLQIQGTIKPLRDFFLTLFFVYLGSQVRIEDILTGWPIVVIFTAFALLAKPFIYLVLLSFFGFRKHTLFQTSLNLSQISEFSLIVLVLGVKMGTSSQFALSIMAAVAVLSIVLSSVSISYSRKLYRLLGGLLAVFERGKNVHFLEAKLEEEITDHVILIGAHRVGAPIVQFLHKEKIPFVVLDFNPHVVQDLREQGIKVIYGDLGDPEILDNLQLERAKLIISTAQDFVDNELLLEECSKKRIKAKVVVRAYDKHHAKALKDLGAEYVILPEKVSGDYLSHQMKSNWPNVRFSGLE